MLNWSQGGQSTGRASQAGQQIELETARNGKKKSYSYSYRTAVYSTSTVGGVPAVVAPYRTVLVYKIWKSTVLLCITDKFKPHEAYRTGISVAVYPYFIRIQFFKA